MRISAPVIVGGLVLALVGSFFKTEKPALPATTPLRLVSSAEPARLANVPLPRPRPPLSVEPQTKAKVEVLLTAAAIAAIIVQASRSAYYATGRPCACPDDTMRNGRRCGSRSAYSRPGGAAPLCYVSDVTPEMISTYRTRIGGTASATR